MYQYLKFIGTHIKLFFKQRQKKSKDAQQVEPVLHTRYYKLYSIIFWEYIIQRYIQMTSFAGFGFLIVEIYSINYDLM